MKRAHICRGIIYAAGLMILALGITLNTKTGLGVSALVSISYCISELWNLNFGNMTFVMYSVFMVCEMAVHIVSCRRSGEAGGRSLALVLLIDLLQLPMSLVFTRFINLFGSLIPDLGTAYPDSFPGSFAGRFLFLLLAIVCTGVGAAMSLNMRLVPCPADGAVQAIADASGKSVGFVKNCFDICNVCIALVLGLAAGGRVIGIGAGTVAAMLGVGRVIAVFNRLCKGRLDAAAGTDI